MSQITMRSTSGMHHERSRCHSRSAGHDKHRFRVGMRKRSHVAQHALQAHIVRIVGRLDLAGGVETSHAVGANRHSHGSVVSFAHISAKNVVVSPFGKIVFGGNHVRVHPSGVGRSETAVSHHSPGQCGNRRCQPDRKHRRAAQ